MMENAKEIVREKYGQIAVKNEEAGCGCGCSCGSPETTGVDYTVFSEDYSHLPGYMPEADLGLGCGIPVDAAGIREGDIVIDLGSGAGNDCFVAAALAGPNGRVLGIDMTEEMVVKARENAQKRGLKNVGFFVGDIEKLPVPPNVADVVLSNCVLNLVPDKKQAFREIFRILIPGGRMAVSDVVLMGELPESVRQASEMYAGCVAGAIQKDEYLRLAAQAGLDEVQVVSEKRVAIPDEVFLNFMSEDELRDYRSTDAGIFSITLTAVKPGGGSCGCGGCDCK